MGEIWRWPSYGGGRFTVQQAILTNGRDSCCLGDTEHRIIIRDF